MYLTIYWNYVRICWYATKLTIRFSRWDAIQIYKHTTTIIIIIITKNHNAVCEHEHAHTHTHAHARSSYWFTKVKTIDWFCSAFVWYEFPNRLYEIYYGDNLRPTWCLFNVHIDILTTMPTTMGTFLRALEIECHERRTYKCIN